MSYRFAVIPLAVLTAVAFGLSASAQKDATLKTQDPVPPRTLSRAQKLARAKTQVKVVTPAVAGVPVGIVDSLTLSVNRPAIQNKGRLLFKGFNVTSSHSGGGFANFGAGTEMAPNFPPFIHLEFIVARPKKLHMLTFYVVPFRKEGRMTFEIQGFPSQSEENKSLAESKTAFVVFTPTKAGKQGVMLKPAGGMAFFAVDIDVLD